MLGLVLELQHKVRREFQLSRWNEYFYRHHHGHSTAGCSPCKRYYQLLDSCPLRIPFPEPQPAKRSSDT